METRIQNQQFKRLITVSSRFDVLPQHPEDSSNFRRMILRINAKTKCKKIEHRLIGTLPPTTMSIFNISQATRQPETEHSLGGWVAPVGSNPTAMLLQHAGADDESRRPIPAIAMIDAGGPPARSALKKPMRWNGVKNTDTGNRLVIVSLSSERATNTEVETSRRKEEPAKSVDQKPKGGRNTLEPKGKGLKTWETRWIPRQKFEMTSGSSAEAPAGCYAFPRTQQCRNRTWTLPRALAPQGVSRTLAACARRTGSQPSKCPGQRLGYAKFGIGTSRPTKDNNHEKR